VTTTIELDDIQHKAVSDIVAGNQRVSVLCGGPGRGKTTVTQFILAGFWAKEVKSFKTFIMAPTGKAAKVLMDALSDAGVELDHQPTTIHRGLGCRGREWEYNAKDRLDADLIIVDESSMIDSLLLNRLFTSVSRNCRFVLVGDKSQLPPVGAGNPFLSIVNHHKQVVSELITNYRQEHGSLIANACELVISGDKPVWGQPGQRTLNSQNKDDLFFHEHEDKEEIPMVVVELCREWFNNGDDYVVLSPQHTGICGVEAMNFFLQDKLNPPSMGKAEISIYGWKLREGDKVLHTKNNYKMDVFNGFTGVVVKIDPGNKTVIVDYDGELYHYADSDSINQIQLGYVLTVHKSQGSQYKKGVLICHSSHFYMWSRQLLYTALSRFRKELHVVGNMKAVKRAVQNNTETKRNTYLSEALGGGE